jgi:hypothetical protein
VEKRKCLAAPELEPRLLTGRLLNTRFSSRDFELLCDILSEACVIVDT